jgi:hypothetical protein
VDNNKIHSVDNLCAATPFQLQTRAGWNNSRDEETAGGRGVGVEGAIKQFTDESQMELVIC